MISKRGVARESAPRGRACRVVGGAAVSALSKAVEWAQVQIAEWEHLRGNTMLILQGRPRRHREKGAEE